MIKIRNNLIVSIIFLAIFFSQFIFSIANETQSQCIAPTKPSFKTNYVKSGFGKPAQIRVVDTIVFMSAKSSLKDDPYNRSQIIKDLQKKKLATHFIIDREGKIYKLVPENKIAFFSKKERMPDGRNNIEKFAIGITLIQKEDDTVTDMQYNSLVELASYLSTRWTIKNIVSLRGITAQFDIGPYNMDWNRFKTAYDTKCDSVFVGKETMFNCPIEITNIDDQNLRSLTLNPLSPSYIPPNLVPIKPEYSEGRMLCIKSDTYEAYKKMRSDAQITNILININSAFRDSVKQKELYLESKAKGQLNHVAEVGESEHQLGTAFDFYSGTVPQKFVTTPEYTWMTANAWKYGFVETYRQIIDSTNIKINEPWHWRYVGIEEAKKIFETSAPLISYLEARLPSSIKQ